MGRVTFRATFEDGVTKSVSANIYSRIEVITSIKPNGYDNSYGIDWCEMNDDFTKIKKTQETNSSDISHVLDSSTGFFKTGGTEDEKQQLLKKQYETIKYLEKETPLTWINLPKGKTAIVDINIWMDRNLDINEEDYISFQKNENFTIEYNGEKNEEIQLKGVKKGKNYKKVKITALNTFNTTNYIVLESNDKVEVGKIEMAVNDVVSLAIKIIPLVFKSNPANEINDAKNLYKNALNGEGLTKTLNNKAFNQVGVGCSIENIKTTPEYIVIDVTKGNWEHFYNDNIFKDWEFQPKDTVKPKEWVSEDGDKLYNSSDTTNKKRMLLDELEDSYYSLYGGKFKGALIFVTDKEYYKPSIVGYSQNNPLRSQGTIIFNGALNHSDAYVHEIGHMLGLEHTFFKDDDLNETNAEIKTEKTNNIAEVIDNRNDLIANCEKRIKNSNNNIKNYGDNGDGTFDKEYISEQRKEIEKQNFKIDDLKKEIESFNSKSEDKDRKIRIFRSSGLKIEKSKSKNFMDYDTTYLYFQRNQALILKQECIDFYK